MDTIHAYIMAETHRNQPLMIFDWMKCVKLIKEHNIKNATAGLEGDMEWTGGCILRNGKPYKTDYTYLSSTWATPILVDKDTGTKYDCYVMEGHTRYNEKSKWPKGALKALNEQ